MASSTRMFHKSTAQIKSFLKIKFKPSISSTNAFLTPPIRPTTSLLLTRLPVELAGGESLMPLHSATASSLLKSMLSSKVGQWGSLSEGFATPL